NVSFAPETRRWPSALKARLRMGPRWPRNTIGLVSGSGDVRSQSLIVASVHPPVASQRPSGLKTGDATPGCRRICSVGGEVARFKRCTKSAGLERVANHLPFGLNTRPAPTPSSSPRICETAGCGAVRRSHRRNFVGSDGECSHFGWANGEETFHSRTVVSLLA